MAKKISINLNIPIKDLDGKPLDAANAPATLGKMLASVLASSNQGKAIKMLDWALALHGGEVIELDNEDYGTLRSFVEDSTTMTNLAKGQILRLMAFAKEASSAPAPVAAPKVLTDPDTSSQN